MDQLLWQIKVKEDNATVTVPAICTPLGGKRYRLDSIPEMVDSIRYGDVFEGEAEADVLRVQRVVRKSEWQQYVFQIVAETRQSQQVVLALETVERLGGIHADFWCFLTICLPPGAGYDPTTHILGSEPPGPGLGLQK